MFRLKFVGVGLLLTSLVGSTMYACAEDSDLRALFGAAIGADCKTPCKDDNYQEVTECDDLKGEVGKCEKRRCTYNKLAYLTCTPKDKAGSGAKDCEYWNDPDAPRRWITVRILTADCKDGGKKEYSYGDCADGGGYPGTQTPCVTDKCEGEIYNKIENKVEAKNRTKCGKKPAA